MNTALPPEISPGGSGIRPSIDITVTLLPQPLSPTIPRSLPGPQVKGDTVHGVNGAILRHETRCQIFDFQHSGVSG